MIKLGIILKYILAYKPTREYADPFSELGNQDIKYFLYYQKKKKVMKLDKDDCRLG